MKKKTSSFDKTLAELLESDIPTPAPLEATEKIENVIPIDIKKKPSVSLDKIPVDELTPDQKEIMQLRNTMADLRMRSKLAEGGLSHYRKGIPEGIKKAKELAKKIASVVSSPAGKKILTVGAKLAGPLGMASDVLASEDLGSGEDQILEKMKSQQIAERKLKETLGDEKLQEYKKRSEELSRSPASSLILKDMAKQNQLKEIVAPMVKEVGGEPDIRPEKAIKMLGEKESPDLEDMDQVLNYEDYLKKKKRQLGYE